MFGMGTWRFLLSFLVSISHVWNGMIHGPAAYAVWGFYVLSGYLMALVLHDKYGFTQRGVFKYAHNRIIRIYPLYFISCIIGAIVIYFSLKHSLEPSSINPQFNLPSSFGDILSNLTMLPFFSQNGLLVPVGSALYLEVLSYILMPVISKTKSTSITAFIASFFANCQFGFTMESFTERYAGISTTLLAFSFGCILYHFRNELKVIVLNKYLSMTLWMLNCLIWILYPEYPWTYGLYVSLPLSGMVILSLINEKSNKTDSILGDLSYPIYLLHTTMAMVVTFFVGSERSFKLFLISFLLTIIVSLSLIYLVDRKTRRLKV